MIGDDGRLLAVPARVRDEREGIIRVEVAAVELAFTSDDERRACVVADTFESYDGIRGVIAQGRAEPAGDRHVHPMVALTVSRTATFSFDDDREQSKDVQAEPD